jgi:hypothetical protein
MIVCLGVSSFAAIRRINQPTLNGDLQQQYRLSVDLKVRRDHRTRLPAGANSRFRRPPSSSQAYENSMEFHGFLDFFGTSELLAGYRQFKQFCSKFE